MDPYAAQWAHYGYAIGSATDTGTAAAYPAYYNYPGVQVTTAAGTTPQTPAQAGVIKNKK